MSQRWVGFFVGSLGSVYCVVGLCIVWGLMCVVGVESCVSFPSYRVIWRCLCGGRRWWYIWCVCVVDQVVVFVSFVQFVICVSFGFMFISLYLVNSGQIVLIHFVTGVVSLKFVGIHSVVSSNRQVIAGAILSSVTQCEVRHTACFHLQIQ